MNNDIRKILNILSEGEQKYDLVYTVESVSEELREMGKQYEGMNQPTLQGIGRRMNAMAEALEGALQARVDAETMPDDAEYAEHLKKYGFGQ